MAVDEDFPIPSSVLIFISSVVGATQPTPVVLSSPFHKIRLPVELDGRGTLEAAVPDGRLEEQEKK